MSCGTDKTQPGSICIEEFTIWMLLSNTVRRQREEMGANSPQLSRAYEHVLGDITDHMQMLLEETDKRYNEKGIDSPGRAGLVSVCKSNFETVKKLNEEENNETNGS